jgi:cytoskeletal protein CcmA (bactofilin family)
VKSIFSCLIKNQSGQGVLAIVLILVVLGGLIVGPLLAFMGTGLKAGQMHESKELGLYAADSGMEDAVNWLMHGKPTDGNWDWNWDGSTGQKGSYEINDMTVDVTVEALAEENTYKVTSTATGAAGSTTVLSTLWAIHWVYGDLDLEQHNTIYGDVHVTDDVTIENSAKIVGDLTVGADLTLNNSGENQGDVSVDGNIVLGNSATITGDIICTTGNITLGNHAEIYADIHLQGENSVLDLAQPQATIVGNITADGNLTIYISYGDEAMVEILGHIYAPNGNITIYLEKTNSEIQGDIYASGTITIIGPGVHTGNTYSPYTGDPPFVIADCPQIPAQPTDIRTYEVM